MYLNNMFNVNTCKDCKERHVGCHGNCEKYIQAKELCEKRKEEYRKFKRENNVKINKGDFLGDAGQGKPGRWKNRKRR